MTTIKTKDQHHAVTFFANGGSENDIIAMSEMRVHNGYEIAFEYWFTIGHYASRKNAVRAAIRKMRQFGYEFSENAFDKFLAA